LASILLLDEDGIHLRHGAAPSLPRAYSNAIDGAAIGPKAGSCGTAAYRGTPVIVSDISTDPLWEDFRDLAARHGLCACWSTPILSRTKSVLGTFALYYTYVCAPDPDDEAMINMLTRTAALAIEHDRAVVNLAESEDRFRLLTRCAPLGVFMTDRSDLFTYVNPRFVDIATFEHDKTFGHWLNAAAGQPDIAREWRHAIAARIEFVREFSVVRGDVTRALTLRAVPMASGSGTYKGYVGTIQDR
jgi:PAS domain S-box-containing protein